MLNVLRKEPMSSLSDTPALLLAEYYSGRGGL